MARIKVQPLASYGDNQKPGLFHALLYLQPLSHVYFHVCPPVIQTVDISATRETILQDLWFSALPPTIFRNNVAKENTAKPCGAFTSV
jgi:hypothetical protein